MKIATPDYLGEPIFVLGLPRSGTSMVAGSLQLCGAWLGETVPGGGPENPKGFFESIFLREGINKRILAEAGFDPLGISPLPALNQLPKVNGVKQAIHDFLQHEGFGFDRRWLFKEPKLTLLWPIFLQAFPRAKWVIVRRERADIIQSCLRTPFMSKHSKDVAFWDAWAQEYEDRLESLKKTTGNWREITPNHIIAGNTDSLMEIAIWCGLKWDQQKIEDFVTPQYWHAANF